MGRRHTLGLIKRPIIIATRGTGGPATSTASGPGVGVDNILLGNNVDNLLLGTATDVLLKV